MKLLVRIATLTITVVALCACSDVNQVNPDSSPRKILVTRLLHHQR
jgi:hypothetical protein